MNNSTETNAYYTTPMRDPEREDITFATRIERLGKKIMNHSDAIDALTEAAIFLRADKMTGGRGGEDLLIDIERILREYNELNKGR